MTRGTRWNFTPEYIQRLSAQAEFVAWMRNWRMQLRLSQTDFGSMLGIAYSSVGNWETRKQAIPDHTIPRIIEILCNLGAKNPPDIRLSDEIKPDTKFHPGYTSFYALRKEMQVPFRKWMVAERNRLDCSQSELGALIDRSQECIAFWENGRQAIPDKMLVVIYNAMVELDRMS